MFNTLASFLAHRAGNISVTFALALAPVTASVGGALDYTRTFTIGDELQSALDSGVLAAASLTQSGDPEAVVEAFVAAAIAEHQGVIDNLVVTVTHDTALNARTVHAQADVSVPTILLGVTGINALSIGRNAEATEKISKMEISLVLDVSSSMRGSKIDSMREAALEFVDAVFGQTEDVGQDLTSLSVVPYGGTVALTDHFYGFIDPAASADAIEAEMVADGADPGDVEGSVTFTLADWNGCLEMDDAAVRSIDLAPGSFIPVPDLTVWNVGNEWCPDSAGTEAIFLSKNLSEISDVIATFDNPVLSDGTGTDIAASWGVRALDPVWRGRLDGDFSDRPSDWDAEDTQKVMVVMTDGGITAQLRAPAGYDGTHTPRNETVTFYSESQARTNFNAMCDHAKNNGAVVYTIAFQVNGSADRQTMLDCATSPDHYYDVQDLNIAAAFNAIAADLNRLRLSQ
jgi:Flp pilus assembly protein TadG